MVVTERGCNFILYYGAWSAREARVAMIWGSERKFLSERRAYFIDFFPRSKQERRQLPQLSRFLAEFVTLCRQKNLYRRSFTFWSLWIISSRFSEWRYSKIIRLGQYFAGFSLRHNFFLIYDCELGSLLENNMVYWLLWLQSCATAIEKQKCGELLCLLEPGSFSVFRFIYKMMQASLEEVSSHASIDSTSIIQWMEKQRYRMANK